MDADENKVIINATAIRSSQNIIHILRQRKKKQAHYLISTMHVLISMGNFVIKMHHCCIFNDIGLKMKGNISSVSLDFRRTGRY